MNKERPITLLANSLKDCRKDCFVKNQKNSFYHHEQPIHLAVTISRAVLDIESISPQHVDHDDNREEILQS